MNVFSDLHHSSLYYSQQLLFEKRLGHQLFRPIGLEWFWQGYWKINDLEETARQYLQVGWEPADKTQPLNDLEEKGRQYFLLKDNHNNTTQKAITLGMFQQMPIDIVIASIPKHIEPFKRLAKMKNAKFIFQMGNVFPEVVNNLHEIPNLMANTLPPNIPASCHYVQYHQEFPLDIFYPSDIVVPEKQIVSFINVYQDNAGFEDYLTLKSMLPDYKFLSLGGQCMDGSVGTTQEMADIMRKSYFGFHSKRMGDGFGHVIWNWAFVGKPIITRISDYKGKIAEPLLEHMETCIDLDTCTYEEACGIIQNMEPYKYQYMCQEIRRRAEDNCNFDLEEIKIREFLSNLK